MARDDSSKVAAPIKGGKIPPREKFQTQKYPAQGRVYFAAGVRVILEEPAYTGLRLRPDSASFGLPATSVWHPAGILMGQTRKEHNLLFLLTRDPFWFIPLIEQKLNQNKHMKRDTKTVEHSIKEKRVNPAGTKKCSYHADCTCTSATTAEVMLHVKVYHGRDYSFFSS